MQHELVTLKNNLQTLYVDSPGSTAASVQIWFRAGSALEKKEDHGIAHFLEHMFFKGTQKRPGARIAHDVESFGGEINAFTSFDYTCYYINTPANQLAKTTDILLDMVSNPQFKIEDIKPERGVVFEEFRRSIDNPNQFSFQRLQKSAFSGAYAHPILGSEKTILNFSKAQLKNFRKENYNLANALLVVAGDLKQKNKVQKIIEGYKLPKGNRSQFPKFKLKNKPTIEVHQKDTSIVSISLCLQAPNFEDKNAAAEDLAINCLGHGESSRLYQSLVVSDSTATSCGTSTMFMNDGGLHFIKIICPVENIQKSLDKLQDTLVSILQDGLEDSEVNKIKNQYIASKVYDMESLESYAFSLGHSFASTGDISSEEEFIRRIKSTSVEQVNAALHKILKRSLHISVQIPQEHEVKEQEILFSNFQKTFRQQVDKIKPKNSAALKAKNSAFDPQVNLYQIKPGIQLLYRQNTMNPTFVLHAYLKGGITEETPQTNGLYHLISSTINKGYDGIDYHELKNSLDNMSASLSSFSGKNAYGVTMHGQSDHFKTLCDYFNNTLLKPSFNESHINHEIEIATRIIENHKKDPLKNCFKKVGDIFFNDHPYSMNVLGTNESIKNLSASLIQETHRSNLENNELLLTYCGDKSFAEVYKELTPLFEGLDARKKVAPKKNRPSPILGQKEFIHFEREQTQIFTGIPTHPLGHKDNISLKFITTYLSGQSSELFVEVRDRQGLCYTAQPVHFSALEAGYWGIYMASGHDKVEAALNAINDILDKIKTKGISKTQFNRIKKMMAGQNLLNIQTNDDYANIYSVTTLQAQGLDFYHENNIAAQQLKYEDFLKTIKKLFSKNFSTVIVGKSAPEDFS